MEPILSRRHAVNTQNRLIGLAPDQMAAGLEWLAARHPHIFTALLDAAETWDDGADPVGGPAWERYCVVCGAQEGVIVAVADDWRHYAGDGPPGPHEAGHPYVAGWRPPFMATAS